MSSLFSSDINQIAFKAFKIQETGEKCWATLDSEAKKEILKSIAKAVAAVFFAIILTGAVAGLIAAGVLINPAFMIGVPATFTAAAMTWGLAGCLIKDAVKTVQKHLPPNPNLSEEGFEVIE